MLLVAMSCLQGRPMDWAFDELARLADGVQLTPGNLPTAGFAEHVAASGVATRTHHGYAPHARRRAVWGDDGACLTDADSVHPPERAAPAFGAWRARLDERRATQGAKAPLLETMYPGYDLGSGDALRWAMDRGLWLAVDVSHVFIQREQGAIDDAVARRLQDYERVGEVHVSANDGRRDTHRPLTDATFGLAWARERLRAGTPVVLECYMHKLSEDERRRQVDLARG